MSFQRWIVGSMIGTALFSVGLTRTASASVLWRGDFSTSNLTQWTGAEVVSSDRLAVVKDPLGSGKLVLKATVHQGDDPINSSGNRNEVFYSGDDVGNGKAERYYHWRTLWPSDYASENTWQLFTQWHQYQGGGSPPVEFFVNGENVNLTVLKLGDHPIWQTSLQRGVWHDFVFHVRWSTDASVGFVELWYDGTLAIPKTYAATMFGSDGVYLKQGLYRNETISATQSVFHTGMALGTTLDDVWPVTPTPPATTTETPAPSDPSTTQATTTLATSGPAVITASTSSAAQSGASPSTASNLKTKAGCSQAGWTGLVGTLPLFVGLIRRRRGRRTI
jgi:hypothetical protein